MKKNLSKVLVVLLSIFTLLNFISCSGNTEEDETPGFTISFPGNEYRTAEELIKSVVRYELTVEEVDGTYKEVRDVAPGETVEITNLKICEYKLSVSAFDKNNKKVAYGEKNAVPLPKNYEKINIQKILEDFGVEIIGDVDWDNISNEIEIVLKPIQ